MQLSTLLHKFTALATFAAAALVAGPALAAPALKIGVVPGIFADSVEVAAKEAKKQGLYVQPDKVQPIAHEGPYYRAHAIHMSAPSPQRTPVLFQAGTSARGMQFAGQHGEGIFIGASSPEAARETSRKLRAAAVAAGRRADDVKIYVGLAGAIAYPITTPAPAGATRRRPGLRCRQWRSSRHALALQTLSCFFLRRGLGTVVGRAAVVAGSDKDGAAARSRATAIA